jgi:hypothetical protein
MLDWNNPRPLSSGPGRALATRMNDLPGQAYLLLVGTLEQAGALAAPEPGVPYSIPADQTEDKLTVYLEGVAAAAIVADAATGRREWTGARDFAVNGDQVELLRPEAVLLGTLVLAYTAACRAVELAPVWEALPGVPPVPEGHAQVVAEVRQRLVEVTQARMTQVSDRAEDANG